MESVRTEAVTRQTYAGLFMVTLSTLMYEILLTRIFSVTMWYHFAFMAISVAMFGMTLGAIIVYLLPRFFTPDRTNHHLALSSLLFAVSIVFSFLTHLSIPFVIHRSIVGVYSIALTYTVIAVPFVFSGICVCLALTRFPRQVSRLYAVDLAGAALGCILLVQILKVIDAPTAVIAVALMAGIGAVAFAAKDYRRLQRVALVFCLLFALFIAGHTYLVVNQRPLLRLVWVKDAIENARPLYEKWNAFSRVTVKDDRADIRLRTPVGWGLSPVYPSVEGRVKQMGMNIDAAAGTVLTAFNGNLRDLEHLKYDVTNIAHYIRHDAKVLVVGVGGGRDLLSALAFEQKSVLGVEINENILRAVNLRFGDFTGHLDKHPRVTFVNDEARSYVARHRDRFDIIQVSLIDTWAATAAGAFILSENSLYTMEAWHIFLERLTDTGVLTFSRWYFRDRPGEMYRLTSLASASLREAGIQNPRQHIVIVRVMRGSAADEPEGVGTILVSKAPFSSQDLDTLEQVARDKKFEVVLSPTFSLDTTFAAIASAQDVNSFAAQFPINIAPPTDDSPFFFNMLRLRDIFNQELIDQGRMSMNMKAVFILGVLVMTMVGLTLLCIIGPLILTTARAELRGAVPVFLFFAGIGLGFMLVEISQMQRLIVFLGHPTYSLSVVLFALLLSSGAGSHLTQRVSASGFTSSALILLSCLLAVLVVFGVATPYAITFFQASTTSLRIAVSLLILLPLGLFMGMAFPLGMKLASGRFTFLTPWLWGINGATSVCGSVLAVVIALSASISASFWTGVGCYGVAFIAFVFGCRAKASSESASSRQGTSELGSPTN